MVMTTMTLIIMMVLRTEFKSLRPTDGVFSVNGV